MPHDDIPNMFGRGQLISWCISYLWIKMFQNCSSNFVCRN